MKSATFLALQESYNTTTDEYLRIDILSEMTLEMRNDDVEIAFEMTEEIISKSKELHYKAGLGNGKNHKGACYWIMGEYEEGLIELTEAYNIAIEIEDQIIEAKVLNNFGRIYRGLGDLANAIKNFEAALELNERNGNEFLQTINLTNISILYYDLGDYDTALEYALKCLPIFEKYKNTVRLMDIYNTLGDIYFKKENYEEALKYFKINRQLSDPETANRALADSGIGKVLFKQRHFEEAKEYLLTSMKEAEYVENIETEIIANFYYGKLNKEQGNYSLALQNIEKAYDLAQDTLRKHDLMNIHESLSEIYDIIGNIPKAFNHLKSFEKLKEEIFQQATLNKLRNLQIKSQVEVAKKEKELALQTAYLKQQFMANMSHEIRTPMNAILGLTRLLIEKNPKPDQIKYLNAIKQSSDNLLIIINDILDFSKIEAGKITIEHHPFSLRSIVENIKEMMDIKAQEKTLDFTTNIEDKVPDQLIGDSTRLTQILVNLIGNAIKFTEKGSVLINISTLEQHEDQVSLKFDVIDTGIGISKEYVNRIFESFTQAGTDTARKFGGTGLGLTISKQLVDLMDGKIYVESEQNVGTRFTVELQFSFTHQAINPIKESVITTEELRKLNHCHILLVEDNEFNQMVAEDTLKEALPNIEIDIAENGKEAVEMVLQNNYDIIIMDIQMPVMNGVDATKAIRLLDDEQKKNISIIAMTANVLQEDVKNYLEVGMNAYISKPFKIQELITKISRLLPDRIHKQELLSETTINTKTDTQEAVSEFIPAVQIMQEITDLHFLDQFTKGDQNKVNKYIKMFVDNAPTMLERITNFWAVKDYANLRVAVHSLKPQLSYMGVKEEISHVYQLEQAAANELNDNTQMEFLVQNLLVVTRKAMEELVKKN